MSFSLDTFSAIHVRRPPCGSRRFLSGTKCRQSSSLGNAVPHHGDHASLSMTTSNPRRICPLAEKASYVAHAGKCVGLGTTRERSLAICRSISSPGSAGMPLASIFAPRSFPTEVHLGLEPCVPSMRAGWKNVAECTQPYAIGKELGFERRCLVTAVLPDVRTTPEQGGSKPDLICRGSWKSTS